MNYDIMSSFPDCLILFD